MQTVFIYRLSILDIMNHKDVSYTWPWGDLVQVSPPTKVVIPRVGIQRSQFKIYE